METLYFQTNSLIQEIQTNFQQLNNVKSDPLAVENEIQTKIATVNAYVDHTAQNFIILK